MVAENTFKAAGRAARSRPAFEPRRLNKQKKPVCSCVRCLGNQLIEQRHKNKRNVKNVVVDRIENNWRSAEILGAHVELQCKDDAALLAGNLAKALAVVHALYGTTRLLNPTFALWKLAFMLGLPTFTIDSLQPGVVLPTKRLIQMQDIVWSRCCRQQKWLYVKTNPNIFN